ncbi:hypothetical protein L6R52_02890 [Myxococcota bacterium]|nr:hypothetical protein [Myxococcota bacterium]
MEHLRTVIPLAVVAVAVTATASVAHAQGLAARFGHLRAVEGEPLVVRVELDDPACRTASMPCLVDTIGAVEVELRTIDGGPWIPALAEREGTSAWWRATFPAASLPRRADPTTPARIEVRARVTGTRGGVLLELGGDEPLDVEVVTAPEARVLDRALGTGRAVEDEALTLVGFVGVEGRAGSSARARLSIGVGGRTSARTELAITVAVGPAFAVPTALDGGGPIVLGFDGGLRVFSVDPATSLVALFVEPFAGVDLRFPGVDPGAGLRAGLAWSVSHDVGLEVSVGGAAVSFARAEGTRELGFSGGLRLAMRFGGRGATRE